MTDRQLEAIGQEDTARRHPGGGGPAVMLAAAPGLWILQLLAGSAIASSACGAGDGPPLAASGNGWAYPALVGINLGALLLALLALSLSQVRLRRTERAPSPGDDEMGTNGPTRFLLGWALATSVLFAVAIGVNTIGIFWVGLCGAN